MNTYNEIVRHTLKYWESRSDYHQLTSNEIDYFEWKVVCILNEIAFNIFANKSNMHEIPSFAVIGNGKLLLWGKDYRITRKSTNINLNCSLLKFSSSKDLSVIRNIDGHIQKEIKNKPTFFCWPGELVFIKKSHLEKFQK